MIFCPFLSNSSYKFSDAACACFAMATFSLLVLFSLIYCNI